MIRRDAIQDAAFWGLNLCLSCGATGAEDDDPALALAACEECGEETIFFAPAFERGLCLILADDEE